MGTLVGALQVWGAWVLLVAIAWNVYRNVSLFKVMYFLYTKTFVGPWFHGRQLKKYSTLPPHSESKTVDCGSYVVRTVAYLGDNYAYIIEDKATHKCAVVDPADADRVMAEYAAHCQDRNIDDDATLVAVLTTHKHMDHAGGNLAMKSKCPGISVYGGTNDKVAGATTGCNHGDTIVLGETTIKVLDAPGHTKGSVLYHVLPGNTPTSRGSMFTGDFLFVAGCGKFFEGDGKQLATITMDVLPSMFGDTYIWCGHEYTASNLQFASWVEPNNDSIKKLVAETKTARDARQPTVPSTIDAERQCNPFCRLDAPAIRAITGTHESSARGLVANILRSLKDRNVHKQSHKVESDRGRKWL